MHERINRQDILVTHDKIMDMVAAVKVQQINAACLCSVRACLNYTKSTIALPIEAAKWQMQSSLCDQHEALRTFGMESNRGHGVLAESAARAFDLHLNVEAEPYALYRSACLEAE